MRWEIEPRTIAPGGGVRNSPLVRAIVSGRMRPVRERYPAHGKSAGGKEPARAGSRFLRGYLKC